MFATTGNTETTKTTSWKLVLPFYGYAAIAFLIATILLLLSVAVLPIIISSRIHWPSLILWRLDGAQ